MLGNRGLLHHDLLLRDENAVQDISSVMPTTSTYHLEQSFVDYTRLVSTPPFISRGTFPGRRSSSARHRNLHSAVGLSIVV
jgi:hypothetical protein